jgi:hypothetical protein
MYDAFWKLHAKPQLRWLMEGSKNIGVRGPEGRIPAVADYTTADRSTLVLRFETRRLEVEGSDLIDCLLQVRRQLEAEGYQILCKGARRDLSPSGMSRQMSSGRLAYILDAYGRGYPEGIVCILDPDDSDEVTTIDEQVENVRRLRERLRGHAGD